ncbi:hypothetical protein [Methanosphaera sp.]|jgi:hypothetical protein
MNIYRKQRENQGKIKKLHQIKKSLHIKQYKDIVLSISGWNVQDYMMIT